MKRQWTKGHIGKICGWQLCLLWKKNSLCLGVHKLILTIMLYHSFPTLYCQSLWKAGLPWIWFEAVSTPPPPPWPLCFTIMVMMATVIFMISPGCRGCRQRQLHAYHPPCPNPEQHNISGASRTLCMTGRRCYSCHNSCIILHRCLAFGYNHVFVNS